MANNTEMIDSLVSDSALKSLDTLNVKLTSSYTEMENLLAKVQVLSNELTKPAKAYIELSKLTEEQKKLEQDLAKATADHAKVVKEMEELKKKVIQTNSKEVESMQHVTKSYADNSKAVIENAKTLKDISSEAYDAASKNIENNRKNLIALQIEQKSYQEQLSKLDDQYSKNLITEDAYINKKAELMAKEQSQKATVKALADSIKYENQILSTAIGTYDNASAQYSRLKIQINQMTDAEKHNGYTKAELEEQSKALYEQMSNLQKATGKHQLDVGKYDIAVKDLTKTLSILDPRIGMVLTKLQNISPLKLTWLKINDKLVTSLGLSAKAATILQAAILGLVVGGIILAIDAFKKMREENARVQKNINDIYKEAAESVNTQRSRIDLLLASMRSEKTSLDDKKRALEKLQDIVPGYNATISETGRITNENTEAIDEYIAALNKKALAEAAQSKMTEIYNKQIDIQLELQKKEAEQAKYQASIARQQAEQPQMYADGTNSFQTQSATGTLSKIVQSEINTLNRQKKKLDDEASGIRKIVNDNAEYILFGDDKKKTKGSGKPEDELLKQREKFFEQERKLAEENNQMIIKTEVERYKDILTDEKESYENRLNALADYSNKLAGSIEMSRTNQLTEVKRQMDELGLTEEQGREHILLINQKADAELIKLDRDTNKLRLDITKDNIENQQKSIAEGYENRSNLIDVREQDELSKLAHSYSAGKISQEEYEKQKLEITKKYAKERFDEEITTLNNILEISNLSEEKKADIKKKIRAAELKYNKEINNSIIKQEEDAAQKIIDIHQRLADQRKGLAKELYDTLFDAFASFMDAYSEKSKRKLEEESKALDKKNEEDLERIDSNVEAGLMSEEEADARKRIIEESQAERKAQIEEKQKKIDADAAKRDKAIALIKIAIDTAMAVARIKAATAIGVAAAMAASPLTLGQPWASIIAAQGLTNIGLTIATAAVQAAAISAQPIPSYAKGTDNHPGGLARVGDGGRSEMVILPSGEVWKTPDKDTFVNLPKGTEVLPDYRKAMMSMSAHPSMLHYDDSGKMILLNDEVLRNNTKEANNQLKQLNIGLNTFRKNTIHSGKTNNSGYRLGNGSF